MCHSKPPRIFLYCVPGGIRESDVIGFAVTEDGRGLGSHLSSNRYFSQHDMGLTSDWKHDIYRAECPEGYELEWVDDVENHPPLLEAIRLNKERHSRKPPDVSVAE